MALYSWKKTRPHGYVALIAAGVVLAYFILITVVKLAYPWQIDYVEGLTLYISHKLRQGVNIYAPHPSQGFTAASYPLLSFMPALLGGILDSNEKILFVARLPYMLSSYTTITLIFFKSMRKRGLYAASISVLTVLMFVAYDYWTPLMKPDVLALPFLILYVYMIEERRYLLSLIPALIALGVKQQYLYLEIYPLILFYITRRDRLEIIRHLILFTLLTATEYLLMEAFFPGFFRTTFLYNLMHPRSLTNACIIFRYTFLIRSWEWIPLSTAIIVSFLDIGKNYGHRSPLLARDILFLVSLVLSFISSSKLGSNTNYYLFPIALASMIISESWLVGILSTRRFKATSLIFVFLATIVALTALSSTVGADDEKTAESIGVAIMLREYRGMPVWTDEYMVAFADSLNISVDSFYYARLVEKGVLNDVSLWKTKPLLVIWTYNPYRLTPYLKNVLGLQYRPIMIGDKISVYSSVKMNTSKLGLEYSLGYTEAVESLIRYNNKTRSLIHVFTNHSWRSIAIATSIALVASFIIEARGHPKH